MPCIAAILGLRHGFLEVRDRCRKAHERHRRIWEAYRAGTAEEFRRRMGELRRWCAERTWPTPVREASEELEGKAGADALASDQPGCHRTSNAVGRPMGRPMGRLCRLMGAGCGLHGHQESPERRLRGWALLRDFRPYAPRGKVPRACEIRPHRNNGRRHHEGWLHDLMASTSPMGCRSHKPAFR